MKNSQKGSVVPLLITIIAILVIGGGIYFYSQNKESVTNIEPTKENVSSSTTNVSTSTVKSDCGTDMNCFINAAKQCSTSTIEWSMTIDLFGVEDTSQLNMQIKGPTNDGKCMFYSHTNSRQVAMSAETMSKAKSEGVTDDQIQEQLKVMNDSVKDLTGMTTSCTFTNEYLVQLLADWSKGNYSSEDLAPGNCTMTDKNGKII
ncbi:MAG: hypothetical protein WCX27_02325 [Candidatus Paceibacterota bacterium]|jgi:hypothetical protein